MRRRRKNLKPRFRNAPQAKIFETPETQNAPQAKNFETPRKKNAPQAKNFKTPHQRIENPGFLWGGLKLIAWYYKILRFR